MLYNFQINKLSILCFLLNSIIRIFSLVQIFSFKFMFKTTIPYDKAKNNLSKDRHISITGLLYTNITIIKG